MAYVTRKSHRKFRYIESRLFFFFVYNESPFLIFLADQLQIFVAQKAVTFLPVF